MPKTDHRNVAPQTSRQPERVNPLAPDPLVSIVTPSLNTGQYIADALRSVQQQDWPRVEHIVLDAGSTDCTAQVLARFPRAMVVTDAPHGLCEKVNLGFSMARGDVIAWLCSDDYYLPGAIAKAVTALACNPDVALVYCNSLRVDEQGNEIRRRRRWQSDHDRLVCEQNVLPHPTVFFRREALEAVGSLDPRYPLVADWDLWIRISRRFPILHVDDWWGAYRERPGQLSQTHRWRAWWQGRVMARTHGAPSFLPRFVYWRDKLTAGAFSTAPTRPDSSAG
ncbi:glycosyltransferase [Ramlibacter rhizophilus]|uniref:Glycosyltransferase n=1 Tax=Ramlibacter rhizophilus TaxID=1781167 RepID=A0A4Z0BEH5_9BURK|nr:glycosyltransferase [Ramlibacter rhizophilus]TFY96873.1 glycosyltransferase [Ramlibacter rhizophilus]